MTTQSKIILGVAGAALAGFAIGVLTAPCSGEETRSNLRSSVNDAANRALKALRNGEGNKSVSEQIDELVDTAKAKYNEAKGYAKSKSGSVADSMEEIVDATKAKYHEAKGYVKAEVGA
ncbi:MAG: YtxH domain-containing protein [Saprospiraceae bacterium]|nr:YtxH domain-containing protein [Saprospiraceae bacterium]